MVILSCLGLWVGVGDLGELPPHAGKSWNSSPWVEFPIPKDKRPHGLSVCCTPGSPGGHGLTRSVLKGWKCGFLCLKHCAGLFPS